MIQSCYINQCPYLTPILLSCNQYSQLGRENLSWETTSMSLNQEFCNVLLTFILELQIFRRSQVKCHFYGIMSMVPSVTWPIIVDILHIFITFLKLVGFLQLIATSLSFSQQPLFENSLLGESYCVYLLLNQWEKFAPFPYVQRTT